MFEKAGCQSRHIDFICGFQVAVEIVFLHSLPQRHISGGNLTLWNVGLVARMRGVFDGRIKVIKLLEFNMLLPFSFEILTLSVRG